MQSWRPCCVPGKQSGIGNCKDLLCPDLEGDSRMGDIGQSRGLRVGGEGRCSPKCSRVLYPQLRLSLSLLGMEVHSTRARIWHSAS